MIDLSTHAPATRMKICLKSIQDQFINKKFSIPCPGGLQNSNFCISFVSASRLFFLYPFETAPKIFPSPPLNYLVPIPLFQPGNLSIHLKYHKK